MFKELPRYIKDIFFAYAIFTTVVLAVYEAPFIISFIIQILLLIGFFFSKRDYFWLALIFIFECRIGGLLDLNISEHTLAILQGSPLGIIYFWLLFTLVAFLKAIRKKGLFPHISSGPFSFLILYFVILVLVFGINKLPVFIRYVLPWLYLFIIPRLIPGEEDYKGFFNIIFSFVFLVLLTQIYFILNEENIANTIGGYSIEITSGDETYLIRPTRGIFISFISIISALIYLVKQDRSFNYNYLYLVIVLSVFSIFLPAARTWLISIVFILLSFFIISFRQIISNVKRFIIPGLLLLLLSGIPLLKTQNQLALSRYGTIMKLFQGDTSVDNTTDRIDLRSPRVMKKFYESPVIGWGYGSIASRYSDGHVGNQNLLMHTGIVGYMLFLIWGVHYSNKLLKIRKWLHPSNPIKKIPVLLIIFLIGIFIMNSTSQWFGYRVTFVAGFTLSIIISYGNTLYFRVVAGRSSQEVFD